MELNTLYICGLALVLLYFVMGFDDFIWDLITIFRRSSYRKNKLDLKKLSDNPPKILAVAIAAWHESNVIGDVIDNFIESTQYPKSMYHVFLGVYPNDTETVEAAKKLSEKYDNVHTIINDTPGPTCKAQNLNYTIRQIKKFEIEKRWRFASLTIHDSEDVIHPYELKVTNYLIDKYPALQFPVFPLMEKPRFSNFFKNLTTSTYADEFAENHFTTMVSRCNSGAFVPSAGTGFALSRATIDAFGDDDVLPSNSLTEDYRLSLTLYEKGISMFYVLERAPRITDDNKVVWDYVTTRSIFPNTFKTAVKQKTRWILGITMQSFKFKDIYKIKGLRFVGRYSLYKDIKAKFGNLVNLLGYPVLIYFLISLFIDLPVIYPKYSFSWYLSLIITMMMLERQLLRAISIFNVYGLRSVFFSCLFPPLLPIRFVWGNIINFTATVRAYKQSIKRTRTKSSTSKEKSKNKKRKVFAWSKTDHVFLQKHILKRYHRRIGDILLEKGYIDASTLQKALKDNSETNKSIGSALIHDGIITEDQLLDALSNVKKIQYINSESLKYYCIKDYCSDFTESFLRELLTIPLLKTKTGYVFAFCDESPLYAQTIIRERLGITVNVVFANKKTIQKGLDIMYNRTDSHGFSSEITKLFKEEKINYEQVIIANNYLSDEHNDIKVLEEMGLINSSFNRNVLETSIN